MGRRDMQAFSRDRSSSVDQAFGSQSRSEDCGHLRSPLRLDARAEDSEAMTRRLESEGDIRYQTGRGMEERGPAECWWGRAGADPVDRVVVEGPDVGEEPIPSQEPVLDAMGTDQEELGRSLLVQVLGSWR